jgi:hypothetical protein
MARTSATAMSMAIGLVMLAIVASSTPLDDYVNKPDPAYKWSDIGVRQRGPACTFYVLNMTSQSWLSPADWHFSFGVAGNQWWHYILVAIPDVV